MAVPLSPDSMTYADLDPALAAWARRHGLHVFTHHRDDETRSVLIVDDAGDTYSLAAAPTEVGLVSVSVAVQERLGRGVTDEERRRLRHHEEVPLGQLAAALESCYARAMAWIGREGHTRTPV